MLCVGIVRIYPYPMELVYWLCSYHTIVTLHWRHNDHDGVSNHQPQGCLLNRAFRGRSKKTSKLRVTGLCVGNSPVPVNSPHKGPVTRKMFPFDDVIMTVSAMKTWANGSTWTYQKSLCKHNIIRYTKTVAKLHGIAVYLHCNAR